MTERPDVDITDPTFHVGDPHPAYRWMRHNESLYRDRTGFILVTRMDHVREIERLAHVFSSSHGYRSVWFPTETSMISKDDPDHAEQRKLVADHFKPKAVAELEPSVREIVTTALNATDGADQFEVIDTIAARLSGTLTCRLLGWPDDRWRDVSRWSEHLMRVDTIQRVPEQLNDAMKAIQEIAVLTDTSVREKRECPMHDVMSSWANGSLNGEPMSLADINSELGLVIPGGAETTRTALSRSLILFAERPDLWEWLAQDPSRIPVAVEELLRFISPLNNMFRTATEDTSLHGYDIAEGDRLALVYPSANRDEVVYDRADELILDRDPNHHVAFGIGTHFCLGAHVARLSLRVALEELTSRFTRLRAAAPPIYETNVFVKGVQSFELAFDRR